MCVLITQSKHTMKKNSFYTYILAFLLAGGCFASCSDLLEEEPNAGYDKEYYFASADRAEMAVMGIYNSISDYRHYGWYEMGAHASDDTYFTARVNSDNQVHDMVHYTLNSTNEWVESLWQFKYQGIDRANATIAGIQGMADYGDDESLYALEAEARFLRAFLAFDLVKYWGDVPFKTSSTGGYEEVYGTRVSRETIYDQIIEDLDFAKEHLDWATAASSPERPTQGAARGLLMRVCLQRAGYSLQDDGTLTCPQETVRQECFERVIDEWEAFEENGYHDFYSGGYEALFHSFSQDELNSQESIFEIALYHQQDMRNGSAWGIYNGPQVAEPTGIAASEAGNYMQRSNGFFYVVPEWMNFFDEGDVRDSVNICTHRWIWNEETRTHTLQERAQTGWYVGKWRREWMTEEDRGKNMNYADVNFCVLRYADVVLMAAEAYNETGNTSQAWTLINRVRQRAGATPVNSGNYATLLKAPKVYDLPFIDDGDEQGRVRTALYWERGFELAFEGQRKYDLIRWGVLNEALQLFGANSVVNQNGRNAYPAYMNFQTGKHELLPIPLVEMQSNPLLEDKNNPGY